MSGVTALPHHPLPSTSSAEERSSPYQPRPRERVLSLGCAPRIASVKAARAVKVALRSSIAGTFPSSLRASVSEASTASLSAVSASEVRATRRRKLNDVFAAVLATIEPMPMGVVSTVSIQGRIRLSITVGNPVRSGTCQSASNRDPGSASKKDPPSSRVDDHRRRDRRRGAGQGERSGVDLVSGLPPVRSRSAAAGFLTSASSTASWRCRSPGYRNGASAGRAARWSSSRRRTRSATRQTVGSSSRSPRCARRAD